VRAPAALSPIFIFFVLRHRSLRLLYGWLI
jgi:hypothetical protein